MASSTADQAPSRAQARGRRQVSLRQHRFGCFILALVLSDAGAHYGLWFAPFALGLLLGALARRARGVVLLVTGGAVAGWAMTLWIAALNSLPVGATARTIAALAGLPPYAAVAIAVTLLLAAIQALAGLWLARAVFPRQVRLPFPGRHPQP